MSEQTSEAASGSATGAAPAVARVERSWINDPPILQLLDHEVGPRIDAFRKSIVKHYKDPEDPALEDRETILSHFDGGGKDANPYDDKTRATDNAFFPVFTVSDATRTASIIQLDLTRKLPHIANIVTHPAAPGNAIHLIAHALDQSPNGLVTLEPMNGKAMEKFGRYGFVGTMQEMTLNANKSTLWQKIDKRWRYKAEGHPATCCSIQ